MKKLFCVLSVVCLLATLVCVSAMAGKEDEQILVATEPTATNADQTGKVTVWSGDIGRDFTTDNTVAVIDVDKLTEAIRNDLAANGIPTKYEIEAVATYVSGPSGNASWGFFREDAPVYMSLWADKGSDLTKATFSDEKMLQEYLSASDTVLCVYSDNSGDAVNVQRLTLYAYRETGPTATNAEPVLVGDANGDGVINLKDVLVLRKYLAEMPVEIDLVGADMTRDNAVNMKDVLALRLRIAYEKDAGEDEVEFTMLEDANLGDLGFSPEVFDMIMKQPFIIRNTVDLELVNSYNALDTMDETKYNDAFFADNALLVIPHITDTKIETLAALERLSDDSVYLRYDLSGLAPPWNNVSLQLVKISAQDGAAFKTIVTPRGDQTVSFKAFPFQIIAEPEVFWSDFCA